MRDSAVVAVVAIIVLGVMECVALLQGIDSYLFGLVVAAISGLGGYKLKSYLIQKERS